MAKCRKCRNRISKVATKCPFCGTPDPQKTNSAGEVIQHRNDLFNTSLPRQKCPICKATSGFYSQPITIEKPVWGIAAVLGKTYSETKHVSFCKVCDVEVLPRIIF